MAETRSRVVLIPCDTYEEETVYERLKEGLALLGGMERFVKPEEKVLLKPNLVRKAELSRAVVTHPAVMGAVARLVREAGVKTVAAGDSCGFGEATAAAAEVGMDQILKKYEVPVVDFSGAGLVPYEAGVQTKSFYLCKEVLEADALINVCKMKTHALERVTGAVKNLYGCIHGLHKAKGHTQFPSADSFARQLIDLNQFVKPRLAIMDGIVAMEGNGPTSGDPIPMNLLLVSADPVALDSVYCRLINLKPELVPTNYHGEKMGLGHYRDNEIEVVVPKRKKAEKTGVKEEGCGSGDQAVKAEQGRTAADGGSEELSYEVIVPEDLLERYGNPSFNVDRKPVRTGKWVKLNRFLKLFQKKPYIDPGKCVRCGICVESCPVEGKAVKFSDGRKNPPVYDYKKCIRCFCCQEMCPHKAIRVK